ncbi:helix-turn-helix transcriptional regulator [Nonomuraea sp. NPDC050405]|uniref:helix-turn-helix domain-containing protein n=1 Tax=Nonomuraea sp. NPDC050405 TaxID=3154509 RepID=UPI0033D82320
MRRCCRPRSPGGDGGGRRPVDERLLRRLDGREREQLTEIAAGLADDEISRRLFLSLAATRTYVSRPLTKLDARDRARMVYDSDFRRRSARKSYPPGAFSAEVRGGRMPRG